MKLSRGSGAGMNLEDERCAQPLYDPSGSQNYLFPLG